jgi:hypothetical protein
VQIRKEQIHSFRQASEQDYEVRLVHFLKGRFPDAARAPEATLIEGIRPQVTNARSYGLITEQQIAIYVTAAWLLGADFNSEYPAALQVLISGAPADEKSDWLARFTKQLFDTLEPHN